MNKELTEESKKLFSQKGIGIATFLGGPLAAGYLIKKNYDSYHQEDKGNIAFIMGAVSFFLIVALLFLLPEHITDKIPNSLIPFIYTGVIYFIVEKVQGHWLKEHEESGGQFYSGWKATGIGAIFMVIIIVVSLIAILIEGKLSQSEFDGEIYNSKISKFIENEDTAIAVFKVMESAEPQYLVEELNKGVVLWEENKEIVNELSTIENLPAELVEQNKKLLKYCDLRIKHYHIILKAITENTDEYSTEIDRLGMEIEKILNEL